MQGALLWTRHAGSNLSCPSTDVLNGFNCLFAVAYNLTGGNATTNNLQSNSTAYGTVPGGTNCSALVTQSYGSYFDPFASDDNFLLSMLTLECLGATLTQVGMCILSGTLIYMFQCSGRFLPAWLPIPVPPDPAAALGCVSM